MKKILIILLVLIFSSYKSFALSEMDNNTCRLVGENYTTQDSYNLIKVNKDSSYYYVKDNNGKKVVVYVDTNGIQTESKIEFDRIDNMINSPLGTSIAYYGEISGKFILIVNSEIYSNFKEIKDFKFSPDGKNFLFKSNDDYGNEIIIKDGSVFVDNIFKSIDTIYFSEDGKHIFYFAEKTLKYEIDNEIENEANDLLDEFLISYDNFNNNNYTSDNSSKVNNDLANNSINNKNNSTNNNYDYSYYINNTNVLESKLLYLSFYIDIPTYFLDKGYYNYDINNGFVAVNTYESELFSVGNRLVDNKFYSKDKKRYFTIEDSSDLLFNATLNIQGNKYDLGNYMLDIYKPHFLNNNNDVSFTAIYTDNSTTNSGSLKYFFINDKYIGFDDIYYKENFGYNGVKLIGRKGNKIEKMVCNTGGNVSKQIAVKNLILSANNLNTLNGGIDIKTNIDKLSKKELLGNEENILKLLDKYSDLIYTTKFITLEYLYNKIVYLKLNN